MHTTNWIWTDIFTFTQPCPLQKQLNASLTILWLLRHGAHCQKLCAPSARTVGFTLFTRSAPGSKTTPSHKLDQSNISVSGFDAPPPATHEGSTDVGVVGWSRGRRQLRDEILQFQLSPAAPLSLRKNTGTGDATPTRNYARTKKSGWFAAKWRLREVNAEF